MTRTFALAASMLMLAACNQTPSEPTPTAESKPAAMPAPAANPLLTASTLPYQAPPFDLIKDEHYLPAFEQGMSEQLAQIAKIADSAEPPTFENTVEAMERTGETLNRVRRIFQGLVQADTNDARKAIQEEINPKLAAHQDEILLNAKLFARVKAVYDARESLTDPEQKRLVEVDYDRFIRAGANLSETEKDMMRKFNVEETTLSTKFHTQLVAATAAAAVVVDDVAQLDGLSEGEIAAAAAAAKARDMDGK